VWWSANHGPGYVYQRYAADRILFPHRLLVTSSPLSQIKSPYRHADVNPNRITQPLGRSLPDCTYLSCARKPTSRARNLWPLISTKCIYTTGWKRTAIAGSWSMAISDQEVLVIFT